MNIWIKDQKTGLEWGNISTSPMDWNKAEVWCRKQGGRQPKVWELLSLLLEGPTEITDVMQNKVFWTGSSYLNHPYEHLTSLAYTIWFNVKDHYGWVYHNYKEDFCYYTRPVKLY